MKRTNALT